jgi:hypothetical protein
MTSGFRKSWLILAWPSATFIVKCRAYTLQNYGGTQGVSFPTWVLIKWIHMGTNDGVAEPGFRVWQRNCDLADLLGSACTARGQPQKHYPGRRRQSIFTINAAPASSGVVRQAGMIDVMGQVVSVTEEQVPAPSGICQELVSPR